MEAVIEARRLEAVVMAAGKGTRMRSAVPKVLHPLCGRPMLLHCVDALNELGLDRIVVVVGHESEQVSKTLTDQLATETPVEFVEQRAQFGTGDAVATALTAFPDELEGEDDIIIVPGDAPLVLPATLARLAEEHRASDAAATLLTVVVDDPTGYGRIVRDAKGRVVRIVEQADGDESELAITEINTSIYCFRRTLLAPALRRLTPHNSQGEYYLTDVIDVLAQAGHSVIAVSAEFPQEVAGINTRLQLAQAEATLRARINARWIDEGVTMVDPERTYIEASVILEPDVRLLPGTILEGHTVIGAGAVIGPDTRLFDVIVGPGAIVANSVASESEIGPGAVVGPFTHLRAGTRLAAGAKTGAFVEIKNSEIGERAKVAHLSYVGDTDVGDDANLGAGTITANYDGLTKAKSRTRIGAGAHTGSGTVLVAPVDLGDGAFTGAMTLVNRDVPPGALAKGVPGRHEDDGVGRRRLSTEEDTTEENTTEENTTEENVASDDSSIDETESEK